jgi:hypothetical protein
MHVVRMYPTSCFPGVGSVVGKIYAEGDVIGFSNTLLPMFGVDSLRVIEWTLKSPTEDAPIPCLRRKGFQKMSGLPYPWTEMHFISVSG